MHIVHLSSELASVAKVGGLGDVVFGLARQQVDQGHQACVMLPYYKCAKLGHLSNLKELEPPFKVELAEESFACKIWEGFLDKLQILLVEPLSPEPFFEEDEIYGYANDTSRFLAFVSACYAWIQSRPLPDIVHLHDWPTASFSAMAKQQNLPVHTLITLHNVEHQGHVSPDTLKRFKLDPCGSHSLLELGLMHTGGLNAVSKTYLDEIQSHEGGRGLDQLLKNLIANLPHAGIINGIDENYWDPTCSKLASPYSHQTLSFTPGKPQAIAKTLNKQALQKELGLEIDASRPLVACIARLVPQKGLDLIEHALYQTLEQGGQFLLVGNAPIPKIAEHFRKLATNLQEHPHARVILHYTEDLAMRVFAACDLTLIPSLFEPCGLTQLIGFRYGALAIARETGGLKDTVIDLDHHSEAANRGNGFTFLHPDFRGIAYALQRALNAWYHQPEAWQGWVKRLMAQEVSWKVPSQHYFDLYQAILAKKI